MPNQTPPDHIDLPALIAEPVRRALETIDLPMYVVDRGGRVEWANRAAIHLFGTQVGGTIGTSDTAVTTADGARVSVRVHAAPIRAAGRTVAVFALAVPRSTSTAAPPDPPLTARQTETLHLLAQGLSTETLAQRLGISTETARNHIRAVLQRLDAHSRLEAVVEAGRRGLLVE